LRPLIGFSRYINCFLDVLGKKKELKIKSFLGINPWPKLLVTCRSLETGPTSYT